MSFSSGMPIIFYSDETLSINNLIEWDNPANTAGWDLWYNVGGSDIKINATTIANTAVSYEWELSTTDRTNILNGLNTNADVILILEDLDDNSTEQTTITVHNNPLTSIKPNSDTAGTGNNIIQSNNPVNITWNETHYTGITNVKIELSTNGGNDYTEITNNTINNYNYIHNFTTASSSCKIKITCIDTDKQPAYQISSGDFIVVANKTEILDSTRGRNNPFRLEIPGSIAVEKAVESDEPITLSQLEPSKLINFTKRSSDGKSKSSDSVDNRLSHNLIIHANESFLTRSPRVKEGIIELTNYSISNQRVGYSAGIYYGVIKHNTINHNWELGNSSNDYYITGHTIYSFNLEFTEIDASEIPLDNQIIPFFKATSSNEITVYGVDKSSNSDILPNLTKDKVYEHLTSWPHTLKFKYRLTEIIPF